MSEHPETPDTYPALGRLLTWVDKPGSGTKIFYALAALCAGRARPLWGYLAIPLVLGIAVSILTVKQHFVVDGVAGLILGAGAYVAFVHATPRGDQPAYGWRGPLAYTGVLLGFYLAFFALFLGGYAPWTE